MKRILVAVSAVVLLLLALPNPGSTVSVDVGDIHIRTDSQPPPVQIPGQPKLLPIPGRYVYFVADIDVDIFFYHGKWYRPHKDLWFISESYSGPWDRIRDVPAPLRDIPRVFYRVPYGELRDNWERWEREKYWDRSRDENRERY